jgi:hypothetical protein
MIFFPADLVTLNRPAAYGRYPRPIQSDMPASVHVDCAPNAVAPTFSETSQASSSVLAIYPAHLVLDLVSSINPTASAEMSNHVLDSWRLRRVSRPGRRACEPRNVPRAA